MLLPLPELYEIPVATLVALGASIFEDPVPEVPQDSLITLDMTLDLGSDDVTTAAEGNFSVESSVVLAAIEQLKVAEYPLTKVAFASPEDGTRALTLFGDMLDSSGAGLQDEECVRKKCGDVGHRLCHNNAVLSHFFAPPSFASLADEEKALYPSLTDDDTFCQKTVDAGVTTVGGTAFQLKAGDTISIFSLVHHLQSSFVLRIIVKPTVLPD